MGVATQLGVVVVVAIGDANESAVRADARRRLWKCMMVVGAVYGLLVRECCERRKTGGELALQIRILKENTRVAE